MKIKINPETEKIAYREDASMIRGNAEKIFLPETISELQEIVKQEGKITIRGAGTGLVGGAVPQNDAVVDLSKMKKIISIDKKEKEAVVEAGVVLAELNRELEKYNLEFPVNPSSYEVCTIGGMIATNAVGARAWKYGRTADWVKEIEVVKADGESERIGKLGLSDFSGLEGISGIIVKARLKLNERKTRTAKLLKLKEINEVTSVVEKLKTLNDVSMIEFVDKLAGETIGLEESYYLLIEFESDRGELKGEEYQETLKKRDRVYPELASQGYSHIEDPKILLPKFSLLAEWLEAREIPFFGHISVGIIHPCFNSEQLKYIDEMMKYVKKLNGQISGEHGIGLAKKKYVDEADKKVLKRIKDRYDSGRKFNAGKVVEI